MSIASANGFVDSPWTRSDLRRSGIWTSVGLIALVICSVGISRTKTYDDQLLWTALGAISLAIAVLGGVRWILGGMRTVRRERRDVMLSLAFLPGLAVEEPVLSAASGNSGTSVYFTPTMLRFHNASCPFARGKDLVASSRHDVGPRRPCEVCEP